MTVNCIIEVDTAALAADMGKMNDYILCLKSNILKMYEKAEQLDSMWEGDASEAFNLRFQEDYESLMDFCAFLTSLQSSMKQAAAEYDGCEQQVRDSIRQLKLKGV